MTSYLRAGWYRSGAAKSLRTEVLDGAIDVAGVLLRAGVTPERITQLALKLRTQLRIRDLHGGDGAQGAMLAGRLATLTHDNPVLHDFVAGCAEHVQTTADVMAFYLHLIHVTRMIELLQVAQSSKDLLLEAANMAAAQPKRKSAKKKKKKPGKKKAAVKKKPAKKKPVAKKKSKQKPKARGKTKRR